ncbi:unnamed protein product [Leptosia nina]|uniref:Sodium channel protein Nach n=1 Tax=Leptosia nina TaxID=320188 RepID=A0AAV1JPY3_9NEOP
MTWLELLKEAQFHGAARLGDLRHRYLWLLAQVIFFGCSVTVVYVTVTRFFSNPTYIVKLATVLPLKTFPTVIVCPEIDYYQEKVDQFLNDIEYPPDANVTYIRSIIRQLAAFYSQKVHYNVKDLEYIKQLLDYNELDVETAGLMLTASCEETIIKELKNPGYIQEPVKQMHINNIGKHYGLNIAVAQNVTKPPVNLNLAYKWISLRNPGHMYVDIVANGTPLPPGIEIWSGFATETIQMSEEARNLSPKVRRCYLTEEPLKYFPIYHRRYCVLECEMERIAAQCGCSLLHHPPVLDKPLCGPNQLGCARAATLRFGVNVCNCPLACDKERQLTKHFTFAIDPTVPFFDPFYKNLTLEKVSIIRLYLHGYSKTVYSRRSYFSRVNLFAQLGGVFNVFFGCSVLTLLELIILFWRYIRDTSVADQTWPFRH